jgi:hypothetical protein
MNEEIIIRPNDIKILAKEKKFVFKPQAEDSLAKLINAHFLANRTIKLQIHKGITINPNFKGL